MDLGSESNRREDSKIKNQNQDLELQISERREKRGETMSLYRSWDLGVGGTKEREEGERGGNLADKRARLHEDNVEEKTLH